MQPAREGLEKLVAGSLRQVPPQDAPILAWPLVCGSGVADRTQALAFSDGVLRVEVSDPGWKRELEELAPRYLATLNRYLGHTVQRLEFIVQSAAKKAPAGNTSSGLQRVNEHARRRHK